MVFVPSGGTTSCRKELGVASWLIFASRKDNVDEHATAVLQRSGLRRGELPRHGVDAGYGVPQGLFNSIPVSSKSAVLRVARAEKCSSYSRLYASMTIRLALSCQPSPFGEMR